MLVFFIKGEWYGYQLVGVRMAGGGGGGGGGASSS